MNISRLIFRLNVGLLVSLTMSCAGLHSTTQSVDTSHQSIAVAEDGTLLARHAPIFVIEESSKEFNRIGTPAVRPDNSGNPDVYVDPNQPTIYAMEQRFKNKDRDFTNLIYRVHFELTPLYHLTAGKNPGLIIIVTLDQNNRPLLLTTVHTCGCYLAIIPTSYLPQWAYPPDWPQETQDIYGESLPSRFVFTPTLNSQQKFVLQIRSKTHRVMDINLLSETDPMATINPVIATLKPMSALSELPFEGSQLSFFETHGVRKGYVRNSYKPLEKLLLSWWSLDWRVGEDKDLGPKDQTGTTFYTTLKFWEREESDLWNFYNFLQYWGWDL
ncbi:hypothetical protein SAMN05660420_00864 [Desulfuromusa kysingii]|uniref:DUF3179 domain-containing protein n=1 Tax=Desulfuromusa kysingii TaxID=37625 RepID=A0A1H3X7Y2_9BACT|nr:hypothetical protein [Desulfuromusa kysingii]SDZ95507.1 hypothetical protein SAMN05660420_00864 [Desulfuromusa kysingii]